MKKLLLFLSTIFFTANAFADIVDTSLWTLDYSPAYGGYTSSWTSVGGNQAIQNTNSEGSLISDFTTTGDFTYSGTMTPTTAAFDDDDILGIVFGWTDQSNHYRLGWEQGGWNDPASGASGLFLIKEIDGVSTILYETEVFWADNVSYTFVVGRSGDDVSFTLNGITVALTDTTFMSGHIGFYTESQTATFSGLASVPEPPSNNDAVPEPATFLLFVLGILGIAGVSRKKK